MQSKSEDILWIKLKKDQWNIKRDIAIGGIYNSPSNSSYSMRGGNEMWETLESETQHYALENDMLILGDFNGRTCEEKDYIELDDNI